jgi:hypothetical protein
MAVTENFFTGDGSTTSYVLTFEYIDEDDVKVSLDGSITTAYSFANATTILFDTAPASDVAIRIYRDTDIDELKSTFFAGSSIRAQDLNQNFEQNNFAVQEIKNYTWDNETDTIHSDETWVSSDTQIATTAAMDQRFQDEVNDTLTKAELAALSDVIPDNDDAVPTTGAVKDYVDHVIETDILVDGTGLNKSGSGGQVTIGISAGSVDLDRIKAEDIITSAETNPNNDTTIATTAKIDDMIDEAITNDIGTDGTGITVTDDGDGTITLGLADNTIDFSKIKNDDIITFAEQPSVTTSDNNIFTARAAERQFDTIVQTSTPTGSDWEVGKTWLQNDEDKTVSIWNGSAWVPVASGGAFTELAKVVYVDAANGDDSLAGHRISNPKRTIKAAMDQINAETDAVGNGSLIIVAPGIYGEEFPITIEKNDVSIVGTSLRNCIIHPAIGVTAATAAVNGSEYRIRFVGTTDFTAIGAADNNVGTVFTATGAGTGTGTLEDTAVQAAYDVDVPEANELATMFQVNSGTYIQNLTLQGMKGDGTRGGNSLDTDATFGLPTDQGWNFAFFPGATIRKSPYIQNCTNFSDSQINNVNFTPHVPGEGAAGDLDSGFAGGGILIDGDTVDANSPLRSMVCDSYTHTALNGPGIFVTNNGYTQVTSSYAFFTHYHLKCLNGGQANLAASTSDFGRYSLIADGRSTTNIFTSNVDGAANDLATTFNINEPVADASWHGNANRPQPNMLVVVNGITYPILSATPRADTEGGDGWTVEISRPDPANRSNNLGLDGAVADDAAVQFFLRSQIASSGHTMEYVGSGTDYRALPENATGTFPVGANDPVTADATAGSAPNGVPVEDRQTVVLNNGAIWTAITDHNGKFRVGGDQNTDPTYEVDQQLGRVTFRTGSLSFPNLIQNLDTNGFNIFDSTGHVNINDELDVNSNKIVNVTDPTAAQDAATKNYVDTTTTANPIYVAAAGDTMSGELAMGDNKITGLGTPTANTDAATKLYVDSQVSVADKIEEGNSSVEVVDTGSDGTITFTTEGSPRATINSTGRVGIATTSPDELLHLGTTPSNIKLSTRVFLGATHAQAGAVLGYMAKADTTNSVLDQIIQVGTGGEGAAALQLSRGSAKFFTNSSATDDAILNTERARIDSSGRLLVGTTIEGEANADDLTIASSGHTGVTIRSGTANRGNIYFSDGTSGDAEYRGFIEYDHDGDELTLGTANQARIRIDSSGNIGMGTLSPSQQDATGRVLQISGGENGSEPALVLGNYSNSTTGNRGRVDFVGTSTLGNPKIAGSIIGKIESAGTNTVSGAIAFETLNGAGPGGTEHARINSTGRLLIGTSTSVARDGAAPALQVEGTSTQSGGAFTRYSNDQYGPLLLLSKSRGSIGSNTIVQDDDALGTILFHGADGNDQDSKAASISAVVDGTPGSNDMPARLEFSTAKDGAPYPSLAVIIDKYQHTNFITSATQAANFSRDAKIRGINGTSVTNFDFANMSGLSYTDTIGFITCESTNSASWDFLRMFSSRRYDNASGDQEFQFRGDGHAYADNTWNANGADYAEYFEWSDSNPDAEDRRGISVVLDGDKIREAVAGEEPIGVISGNPSVVGDDAWNKWSGKYLRDDFGTYLREAFTAVEWQDENGETQSYESDRVPDGVIVPDDAVTKTVDNNGDTLTRRVLNPDYDPDVTYVPREERPEWDAVGLMGKLRIRKGQVTGARWIKMRDISDSVEEWLVR